VFEFLVGMNVILWSPVVQFFAGIWSAVAAGFASAWASIVTLAQTIYDKFLQIWQPVAQVFAVLWSAVAAGFAGAWASVVTVAQTIYDKFLQIWQPLAAWFDALWAGIVDRFHAIVGPILDGIAKFVGMVQGVGHAALGGGEAGIPPAEGPQVVSPQARAAGESAEASANASVNGEITVKAAPGTTATATGKRSKVPLRVQPSGAF
jgi:hypothetical protein